MRRTDVYLAAVEALYSIRPSLADCEEMYSEKVPYRSSFYHKALHDERVLEGCVEEA